MKVFHRHYRPERCENPRCGQSLTYLLAIDRGTVEIVKAVAAAVRRKNLNVVHPKREMEVPHGEWSYARAINEGVLTSTQIGNFTRGRAHGFIAKVKGAPGNWCLTTKGAQFLKGDRVPRFAIMSKVAHHQIGYWIENQDDEGYWCTVFEFGKDRERWEGLDYRIENGRIVKDLPIVVPVSPIPARLL